MAKLLEQDVIEKLYQLRAEKKMDIYHQIWDAVKVLTDNELISDALLRKIEAEDINMKNGATYPPMFGTPRKGWRKKAIHAAGGEKKYKEERRARRKEERAAAKEMNISINKYERIKKYEAEKRQNNFKSASREE